MNENNLSHNIIFKNIEDIKSISANSFGYSSMASETIKLTEELINLKMEMEKMKQELKQLKENLYEVVFKDINISK